MNKPTTTLLALLAALLLSIVSSCDMKKESTKFEYSGPDESLYKDSTVYGICGLETTMNVLQLITDNGDTLTINTDGANAEGNVLGGLYVGDRIAVILNADSTSALSVINESTLLGNWLQPDAMEGSSEVGIAIKDGGVAESIEQSSLIYRSWRLYNGLLELVAVREGGVEMEEIGRYRIRKLTRDSLIFYDAEELFEYHRENFTSDDDFNITDSDADIDDADDDANYDFTM